MKFMHLVTLLLALWAPLNAVTAGVAMLDCPMNDTIEHSADCPSMSGTAEEPTASAGCDHCGNCVLLGGFSLPAQATPAAIHQPNGTLEAPLADSVAPGVPSTPFRPPLSA
ncbi:hypothetical protein SR882_00200 [Guyparkeria halophila]|uniref:DUF2946 domain-containing protein n=1 Tax=Guyparkeria halophila TaxID=47960 RepID=A0ABZ0YVZ3_9GAMM|nr:hypothetical protein [Guyparkeria halophila]WQH16350.1 hypothetical protein SR882_00200 [Guyparkeria halophila]